jgi:farnesyl diphosphate synthase
VQGRLAPLRRRINETLDRLTAAQGSQGPPLAEAVRYAVLGDGKRIRPILLLASGRAAGGREEDLLEAACAIEMIHAFSLVHDDLPALDDDDLRRGRPTLHVKFGEAQAILAGDALLNLAFQTLARYPEGDGHAARKLAALRVVADAVGLAGMIGGQALDLDFEGREATAADLTTIHGMKTGALITAACAAGGILAGGAPAAVRALERYGRALGLAFQITDDILDVEGSAEQIGKSPGKDLRSGKATFPAIHGMDRSREMAAASASAAVAALDGLGEAASLLRGLAEWVASRRS